MSDSEYPRITVYGATGYTGDLVCRELASRGRDFVAAGRNFEKLQHLSVEIGDEFGVVPTLRSANVDDPSSLDAMLRETNVLINCAGPFTELGPPVAEAAVRNDAHYLDTTGEQEHIRWLRDFLSDEAAENEVVLMPSCAYEYATGLIAAALALEQSATRIACCYGVTNFKTTPGTKKSIVRSIGNGGYTYRGGQLVERKSGAKTYQVTCPDGSVRKALWFPGGEPILVPLLGDVDTAESCLLMGDAVASLLPLFSGIMPAAARAAQPLVDRVVDWMGEDEKERDAEKSPFQVVAFDPMKDHWYAAVFGYEPYEATARIIVEAASRLDDKHELAYGLQTPPSLFDLRDFAQSAELDLSINDAS